MGDLGGAGDRRRDLRDWLADILAHGSGRADAVLLTRAMDPDADLALIAATARALAASKERWTETATRAAPSPRPSTP
jgi:urease accessory protein